MNVHELPLILFTLLSQMAVGAFVVLGVVQVVARRRHDAATVDRLTTPALYAIGPVMVAALLVSMIHLGNPINALNVLNHLGSSWLSREILTGCAFTGLGAAFAICQWRGWFGPVLRQVLAAVTALVGLVFLWATANVYLIPTVPAWNSWTTPVTFFATSFLLGSLAIGTAFVCTQAVRRRRGGDPDVVVAGLIRGTLRGIGVACIVLLGVEAIAVPAWIAQVATDGSPAAAGSMATIATAGGAWLILRLALGVLGAGVLGIFLYRVAARGADRLLLIAASSAFVLVLAAEVLGRVLFFSSYGRIGI
ncbi:dimethyl sulfoxide reductase anchor subunit family protein [Cellulomonas denverensis]|uniref:Dimethyl sulfoxide reductase anchor subunit n=1 Tax=Cellulomonas denverensis TaxID=264297 RepID=A0A7X6KVZ6_9CELL|nr:DmsC/YnfH family molybdoenzyme membrane anchor subunit [Cellulomonas denverensis]NKY23038.1 dimethyl sulfoxide reductase anchor subunit [Cellulomonas denverensis]GIG23882.1 hypothetical protein Cde04nite_01260 [Cellulomonas denverensis]